ncbi:MAG: hypothetical protein E7519_14115 [Ruminococcaceae bacterium]|nr:hypothetical protein [Oscillospiraceae bacterium]
MNDFLTWETLATFAGCTAATAVFTQFLKNAGVLKNVATQLVSYGIAFVLLFGATYFTGGLTWATFALVPFNAAIISLGANGTFSAITRVSSSDTDKNAATYSTPNSNEAETDTSKEDAAK